MKSGRVAGFFQAAADTVSARILPDDGIADRQPSVSIPDDGSLTLIRDADGGDLIRVDAAFGEGGANHVLCALPDFEGIVFDPAAAGENLLVFLLFEPDDGSCLGRRA